MYPLSLEKQNERFFVLEFGKHAERFQGALLRALKKEVRQDSARSDDIRDIIAYLVDLKKKEGENIDRKRMANILKNNYKMIDAWSRNIVTESLMSEVSNQSHITAISMADIPGITDHLITRAVERSLESYTSLISDYHGSITTQVLTGIREGHSYNTIAANIQKATGISSKQAKFYGRDLASSVMGEISRERQTKAGFPGYEWRTMRDERVRDTHTENHGTRYSWQKGADNLSKSGAKHPGDDYNCRCYPKPVRDLSN